MRKYLAQYEADGFVGPLPGFEPAAIAGIPDALMRQMKGGRPPYLLHKRNRHLDWDIAKQLTTSRPIIDFAHALLGAQQLVLWRTQFFVGFEGEGIRWHRDEYFNFLSDTARQMSAHIALTETSEENCLLLVPGSHKLSQADLKAMGFNWSPLADRKVGAGQNYWRNPDSEPPMVKMLMKPGEFFAFHPRLVHASRDLTYLPLKSVPRPPVKRDKPPRMGFTLRITVPQNTLPAAFEQTLPRKDYCVDFG